MEATEIKLSVTGDFTHSDPSFPEYSGCALGLELSAKTYLKLFSGHPETKPSVHRSMLMYKKCINYHNSLY